MLFERNSTYAVIEHCAVLNANVVVIVVCAIDVADCGTQ